MATAIFSSALVQLRGRVGNLVFRKCNGSTHVSIYNPQRTIPATPKQLEMQRRFAAAACYAKSALANPETRAVYELVAKQKKKPLFAVACGDFAKPPVVREIALGAYHGRIGDEIAGLATDDVGVVAVQVTIRACSGEVLETGAARIDGNWWRYTATTTLRAGQAVTIEAVAKDRPGNEGKETVAWP